MQGLSRNDPCVEDVGNYSGGAILKGHRENKSL